MSEISLTRFCSMLIRDSTSRWRSFAAWLSAFSRRSPSSRARLISLGSSVLSSLSSAWISSSNFLRRRAFIRRMLAETRNLLISNRTGDPYADHRRDRGASTIPTPMDRISSRQNPIVRRFRDVARGEVQDAMLLDGEHLIQEALGSDIPLQMVAAVDRLSHGEAADRAQRAGARIVVVTEAVLSAISPVRTPSGIVAIAARPVS